MASTQDRLLSLLCFGVAAVALACAVALAVVGPTPDWVALAIFGGLSIFAANTSVVLPNDSALSASFMLCIASVIVFHSDAQYLGPLLVGAGAGLYIPHLRERQGRKVLFNVGSLGLSALAAAAVFSIVPDNVVDSVAGELAASIPTALTYSLVNFFFLTCALSLSEQRPLARVADELWLGDLQIYPFAIVGVLLGDLYVEAGAWVVPLFVAPILIARTAFASYLELRRAQEATLSALIRALEAKDRYTAGHVERVAEFASYIGEEFEFRPRRQQRLRYAALMHDIGKLVVPNQILNKPGRLTAAEYDEMRKHESASVELLSRIDFLAPVAPSVEAEAVAGLEGPLEARIIHVADAFDAMTSTRAYRKALSQEVAFEELRAKSGSQFDPVCVDAFISAIERRGERYGAGHETEVSDFSVPPPDGGIGSAGLGDLEVEREVRK